MSFLSKSCVYGIRASAYLASLDMNDRGFIGIRDVADRLGISFHFLTKILQSLSRDDIMVSSRGPRGGIALARPPSEITVLDVIRAIDSDKAFTSCILGLPGCGEMKPCPLHATWMEERQRIRDLFATITLEELASPLKTEAARITSTLIDSTSPVSANTTTQEGDTHHENM